ncbi:hypothetical protein Nepgr_016095 [Nepenthes gracilis]|uniref:Uncharacterized protein n=1 Tax=Nepenthes gracilis TaxID=150966 RepID=A0AAD3SP52_NEPGR|nr:hypothetical protein Nepgr_016095 [Nepenthes gracilis]
MTVLLYGGERRSIARNPNNSHSGRHLRALPLLFLFDRSPLISFSPVRNNTIENLRIYGGIRKEKAKAESIASHDTSAAVPRFDYYTDPMAAFSSNKRSPVVQIKSSPSAPRNPETTPSHVYHVGYNQSPYHSTYQPQDVYHSPNPMRSPASTIAAHPMHQGADPYHSSGSTRNPTATTAAYPMHLGAHPYHSSGPSRTTMAAIGPHQMHQVTPPGVWNESSAGSSYYSGNSSRVSGSPNLGLQWAGSPSFSSPGQGRAQRFADSSSPSSGHGGSSSTHYGRGRGKWAHRGVSPGSGRGDGSGISSRGDLPCGFYLKSMVEDPWKSLKPVIWKTDNGRRKTPEFKTPRSLPMSPGPKKPRVSSDFNASDSKQSLADYLAAAFDEAVEESIAEG